MEPEGATLPSSLRYLAVDGAMGLGTSALARLLAERFDARLILEPYEENPYLERFYRNPARWAFQAQLAFLASRFRQQRTMRHLDLFHHGMVADYVFDKDRIFAGINLSGEDRELYEVLYAQMESTTPRPDLVVFMQGSVAHSIQAVRARGRPYEADIDEGYLGELHQAYTEHFFQYTRSPVLIINAEQMDCVHNPEDFDELVRHVAQPRHPGITYLRPTRPDLFS